MYPISERGMSILHTYMYIDFKMTLFPISCAPLLHFVDLCALKHWSYAQFVKGRGGERERVGRRGRGRERGRGGEGGGREGGRGEEGKFTSTELQCYIT